MAHHLTGDRPGALLAAELRGVRRLALPLIVSHLATVGMNTVDTLMVAPLGPVPLAGMAVGVALHFGAIMVGTGILLGMTPFVSQAFGAGNRLECRRVLVQGLWIGLGLSIPLVLLSLLGEPIALALRQDPEVSAYAGGYMSALAWGIPPLMLFMALRQFIEGLGITRPTMVILLIGFALNVPANAVFIYGLGGVVAPLGVVGSGWATSLVRGAIFVAMAVYLLRHPGLDPLGGIRLRVRPRRMLRILRVGAPIGGQLGLEVGIFSFAALLVGWFGAPALAAHQITMNLAATTFMVALGAGLAGTIRVGHHIGARRAAAMRGAVLATYLMAVGFMALCALVFLLFPETLIGLYTADPEVVGLAVGLLFLAALFQVFDGAQVAGMCVLRGAADTRVPMYIAAVGYWGVGLPAGYLLAFPGGFGPRGVWMGLCIGLAAVAVLLVARVRRTLWRAGRTEPDPVPHTPRPVPVTTAE